MIEANEVIGNASGVSNPSKGSDPVIGKMRVVMDLLEAHRNLRADGISRGFA